jgi:hypothetical protein
MVPETGFHPLSDSLFGLLQALASMTPVGYVAILDSLTHAIHCPFSILFLGSSTEGGPAFIRRQVRPPTGRWRVMGSYVHEIVVAVVAGLVLALLLYLAKHSGRWVRRKRKRWFSDDRN